MSDPKRILVTGASGFIGSNFCAHAKSVWPSVEIEALARPHSKLAAYVTPVITEDISFKCMARAFEGRSYDMIFNFAAYGVSPRDRDPAQMQEINAALPIALVQLAAQRAAPLIHAGSSAEYAPSGRDLDEQSTPLNDTTLYGSSKAAGGLMAKAAAKALGVSFVHLRLFNVFGTNEAPHRLFPSLIKAAQTGEAAAMSDGLQVRDFIHIDEVCRAVVLAAKKAVSEPTQRTLNICRGEDLSVKDFALMVFDVLGADPSLLQFGEIPRRPDDLPRLVGRPDSASIQIGFTAHKDLYATLHRILKKQMDAA